MIVSLAPTQSDILGAFRKSFLQKVLPQGEAMFSGSISGTTLTVSKLSVGAVSPLDVIFGQGVLPGTKVLAQLTGQTGAAGTYRVNNTQTLSGVPLNTGVPVIQGQGNRVAQPPAQDFVVFTPMRKPRLATNIDDYVDCYFQGSLDAASFGLTVASVAYGKVRIGSQVFGVDVDDGITILSQVNGATGGVGVYKVDVPQDLALQGMACGVATLLQKAELAIQVDIFGPLSADYAQTISTTFRDQYGVDLLAASGLSISPLYADDPRQMAFVDGEQQYENRWTLEAVLQADQTVTVPQQFAAALAIDLAEVEAVFPS